MTVKSLLHAATTLAILGLPSLTLAQSKAYPAQPAPIPSVKLTDKFWAPRIEQNRTTTLWAVINQATGQGEFDNFAKAAGKMQGPFRGSSPARDSDSYKIIEGIAYTLAAHPDEKLTKWADDLIDNIAAAQEPDGYIYTARKITAADQMPQMAGPARWNDEKTSHETYVMGLLMESGVAYFQATGKRKLLDTAIKTADFLDKTFGPAENQRHDASGHEEIEMALARLYMATGEPRYLKLSQYFVDQRGNRRPNYGTYAQDHLPVIQQKEAVGHAVRAGYLYAGLTDVGALTGEDKYLQASDALWHSVVDRKMYLTGGLGARGSGEAFGSDYELPNLNGYNETCASVANAYWQERLFLQYQDAKYVDVLERILYNQFPAGISLSGDRFFYQNVLESNGTRQKSQRMPWFTWPCCLTNVVRLTPVVPSYAYATKADTAYVNLFASGTAELKLGTAANAKTVKLSQETNYPWDGRVKVTVGAAGDFALNVRVPSWAQGKPIPGELYTYADKDVPEYTLTVKGTAVKPALEKGYAVLKRAWNAGDVVELNLPMPVRRVVSNEKVEANRGRVAIERGPLVYCLEAADNGGPVRNVKLPANAMFTTEQRADLLGGVTIIKATTEGATPATLTAVPYYAWSNRGDGEMAVWVQQ